MKIIITFCLCLFCLNVFAQTENQILLKDKNDLLLVGTQTFFLEDREGKMTIEDVLKPENQVKFQKNTKEIFKPKATDYYYYWIKLTITNQTSTQAWIELGNALLLYVDYYREFEGKYKIHTQTGVYRSPKSKAFPSNVFWLPLNDSLKIQTIYVRIYAESPTSTPIYVSTLETLSENKTLHDYIIGGFLGIVLIMFGYNTFLYFVTKDPIYPWYLGYLFMLFIFMPFIYNYPFIADWFGDDLHKYWYIYSYTWSLPFSIFVGMFFSKFLDIQKKHVFIYRFLLFLIIIRVIFIPFFDITGLISNFHIGAFYQIIVPVFYLFLLISAGYLWLRHQNQNAYYHFVAWSGFAVGAIVAIISTENLIPYNYITRNAGLLGTSWEVLMFSLALANRINVMRKEKSEVKRALLNKTLEHEKTLAEQNSILEKKVIEKTQELSKKAKDLQVINEEFFQTQEELLAQKNALELKNSQLEFQKFKISQSIESAKLIQHAILPTKQKLDSIFAENFVIFIPKDTVSGDFYMVDQIENKKFLVVSDCTGHGVSGAFMTMIGNTLIDRIISAGENSPKNILYKLHTEIQNVLQQKQTNNTDGMDIAIVVLEEIGNQVHIVFAAAKRPLYYLPKGEKEVQKIAGSRKMIGGYEMQNKTFENEYLTLPEGSLLYLCTDGYADQNDIERHKFTEKRMLSLLSENSNSSLEIQEQVLKTQILQHMEGEEQRDDILVLGVKI